ncbi:MAG: hypothetical protein ACRYGC_10015 [Janthinobacterium lividum]
MTDEKTLSKVLHLPPPNKDKDTKNISRSQIITKRNDLIARIKALRSKKDVIEYNSIEEALKKVDDSIKILAEITPEEHIFVHAEMKKTKELAKTNLDAEQIQRVKVMNCFKTCMKSLKELEDKTVGSEEEIEIENELNDEKEKESSIILGKKIARVRIGDSIKVDEDPGENIILLKWNKTIGGIPVIKEDNFIVLMDKHQLKHSPQIGEFGKSGHYHGKRGSILLGGLDSHRDTYGKEVLAYARKLVEERASENLESIIENKVRGESFEFYISVKRSGKFWYAVYHGNPPN